MSVLDTHQRVIERKKMWKRKDQLQVLSSNNVRDVEQLVGGMIIEEQTEIDLKVWTTKVMSGLVIVRYNSRPTKHGRYGVASSSKSPVIACSKI